MSKLANAFHFQLLWSIFELVQCQRAKYCVERAQDWTWIIIQPKSFLQIIYINIKLLQGGFYWKFTFIDKGDDFGTNLLLIIDSSISMD